MEDALLQEVIYKINLDIDLRKIIKVLKKYKYSPFDYLPSLGDAYENFWYYYSETSDPPVVLGPCTINELNAFYNEKTIMDSTLVWHPMINKWQHYICTRQMVFPKRELPQEVTAFIEELKKDNDDVPVFSKQGYLHMKEKHTKQQWRSIWAQMGATTLSLSLIPEEKPIMEINLRANTVFAEASKNTGELSFTIGETKAKGIVFTSSYQKEILEWVTELRKFYQFQAVEGNPFDCTTVVKGHTNIMVRI